MASKDDLNKLQKEIELAEKVKADLDNHIHGALKDKLAEVNESLERQREATHAADRIKSEYEGKLKEIASDKDGFETYRRGEEERIEKLLKNAEHIKKQAMELNNKNNLEAQDISKKKEELDRLTAQSKIKNSELDDLIKKNKEVEENNKIASDEIDGRLKNLKASEADIAKRLTDIEIKLEEIADENKKLNKRSEDLDKKEQKLKKERDDLNDLDASIRKKHGEAVILGKKNEIEAARLKEQNRSQNNREADIQNKLNILNTKIGEPK